MLRRAESSSEPRRIRRGVGSRVARCTDNRTGVCRCNPNDLGGGEDLIDVREDETLRNLQGTDRSRADRGRALDAALHRACAQIQKHGGEFLVTAQHERTSKPGSLKCNYGGVDIQKERNTEAINRLRAEYESSRIEGPERRSGRPTTLGLATRLLTGIKAGVA